MRNNSAWLHCCERCFMDDSNGLEQRFAIWGSGGHAKVLASLLSLLGGQVVALFDNRAVPSALTGVTLHRGEAGFTAWVDQIHSPSSVTGLVAIGGSRGRDRMEIQSLFRQRGLRLDPVVHPTASVCRTSRIGAGTQVLAHAVVAAEAQIGEACIVNHRGAIDHETVLGNGVHVAPGATLCGCVTVGDNVLVGAGAVVLPRLTIGANAIIGAGAVVTRDVPSGVTVMGNPARIVSTA